MKNLLFWPLGAALGILSLGTLPGCGDGNKAATTEGAAPAVQARALEDSLMNHHDLARPSRPTRGRYFSNITFTR